MPEQQFLVDMSGEGQRIDRWLSARMQESTRSAVQRLIQEERVLLNGIPAQKNSRLHAGDTLAVSVSEPQPLSAEPEDIPLDILFEDDDLLVVNKPKGMVVHPAPGNYTGTLVHALLFHCGESLSGIGGVIRPGIVHRIDKDTSGLLMVAKNDFAHLGLAQQIQEHTFRREYEAVVYGNLRQEEGVLEYPIGRSPKDRKKMAVVLQNSRQARTDYQVLARYEGFTHVRCRLYTGRTHQIRVHMAYIGHPIAGDPLYGPKKVLTSLEGQCLHAKTLGFVHPRTGEYLEFSSELPVYFTKFLNSLKGPIS